MIEPSEKSQTSDFLKGLFQRSFELEMLVSGIAILLLLRAPENLDKLGDYVTLHSTGKDVYAILPLVLQRFIKSLVFIVLFNLVLHLLLRCFWVSLIGLNSAFPAGIVVEKISRRPMLQHFLQQHIQSISLLSQTIDNICRVLFSFTFVVAFSFLAITTSVFGSIFLLVKLGFQSINDESLLSVLGLFFLPLILAFIIDLALSMTTQFQELRQKRALQLFFNCVYWFYGVATLSFLYRSVYYTFLTNIRKVVFLAILFGYIFVWLLISLNIQDDTFLLFPEQRGKSSVEYYHYENLRKSGEFYRSPCIQSEVITETYIKLVLSYYPNDNDSIIARNPSLRDFKPSTATPENVLLALNSIREVYQIKLNDSLLTDIDFSFYLNPNTNQPSLVGYIPTEKLPRGKNMLIIERQTVSITWFIPFYL